MPGFLVRTLLSTGLAFFVLLTPTLPGSPPLQGSELAPAVDTPATASSLLQNQVASLPYSSYLPSVQKVSSPPVGGSPGLNPQSEVRAIWLQGTSDDATLDKIKGDGFNTVLYCIDGDVVKYNSSLLPHNGYSASNDALASIVSRAHARGLKVQAWLSVGRFAELSSFTAIHPNWDIAVAPGVPSGTPHWLNFSIPAVRQFVGDVIMEIANNYNVDGIHLDYIRYPSPSSTFTPGNYFSGNDVPSTVQAAYQRLKAAKPNILLTAAVMDYQYRSVNDLQNWQNWISGNYIDWVATMAYYGPTESSFLQYGINWWKTLPYHERIIPGLSVSFSLEQQTNLAPKTTSQLVAQLDQCRTQGFNGFALFDSRAMTTELYSSLATY